MTVNEIIQLAKQGNLSDKTEGGLMSMLECLVNYKSSNPKDLQAEFAINRIRDELAVRPFNKAHQELLTKHKELVSSVEDVTKSVKGLSKPHWTLTPAFWVSVAAMLFAAIASAPIILNWFQKQKPESTNSSFQRQQSNSTPEKPATPQTGR
jgi:hypothetical protein